MPSRQPSQRREMWEPMILIVAGCGLLGVTLQKGAAPDPYLAAIWIGALLIAAGLEQIFQRPRR